MEDYSKESLAMLQARFAAETIKRYEEIDDLLLEVIENYKKMEKLEMQIVLTGLKNVCIQFGKIIQDHENTLK